MDTATIREAVLRRPFLPFTLRLNNGREYLVPHPEFLAVSKRVVLMIDSENEAGVYLEPLLIASLKYNPAPPGPTSANAT